MNNISTLEIINKWIEYSEFDPNQTSFILGSKNYEMNKSSKLASKVLKHYDRTGILSVILLKESFLNILKNERIPVIDAITNKDYLSKTTEMYNMFCSNTVTKAYTYFNDLVRNMYKEVIGIDLLGESKENYASWIEDVVKDIEKLGMDIYKKDGTPIKINKFYKKLLVFDSLGEAVLTLENANDGVYTCYINVGYTSDSYFGFFIKSGENFISFTDRINETYPGQHHNLSMRNGRWAEDKRDTIFPYDTILDYNSYCSKGYAMKFKVKDSFAGDDKNSIEFKELESNYGYDGLILGMLLLKMKYNGSILSGEETYIESLLDNNINLLADNKTVRNELLNIKLSELAIRNSEININFSMNQILGDKVPYKEFSNNELIEHYGKGFTPDYSKIYEQDNIKRLVDKHNTSDVRPEYVGSKERLEKGAYFLIRKQLANYIDEQIEAEWMANGGLKAYTEWYMRAAKENLAHLLDLCMHTMVDRDITYGAARRVYTRDYNISYTFGKRYAEDAFLSYNQYINDRNDLNSFICPISLTSSTIFFVIKPNNIKGIQLVTGKKLEDIPNMIKLGMMNNNYGGNSLLDMVDPVNSIIKPFGESKINGKYTSYNFKVGIGISKRTFNKLLKIVAECKKNE